MTESNFPSPGDIPVLRGRVATIRELLRNGERVQSAGALGYAHLEQADAARVQVDGHLPAPRCVSILFSAVVGSRAQGLATEDSDTDRRGFYVASPDIHFGLDGSPSQLVHDADQLCYWEVEKFLQLSLNANPTVLETLYSPVVELLAPAIAESLSDLKRRGAFLSKRAHTTFMGYADAQFHKMSRTRASGGTVKWQHAMHLIRLLRMGIDLVRTGTLNVMAAPDERDELLAIKRGERSWEEVCQRRDALIGEFNDAAHDTALPDEPDVAGVSRFLVDLRLRTVEHVRATRGNDDRAT